MRVLYGVNGEGMGHTEDTLNRYAAEGYEFVTVPDLMAA